MRLECLSFQAENRLRFLVNFQKGTKNKKFFRLSTPQIDSFSFSCRTTSGAVVTRIHGPSLIRLSPGDTLTLECSVSHLLAPPTRLAWQQDGQLITPTSKPGVSLESEKLAGGSHTKLILVSVTAKDSGSYSCFADSFTPAKVQVQVITSGTIFLLLFYY